MKKHLIDFPENNISIEGFYDRLRPCYDSIMQFGDRVLVAQMNWNGMLEGAVYGFVEDPEEGWSPIECRLELLKISMRPTRMPVTQSSGASGTHTEKGQSSFGSFCS